MATPAAGVAACSRVQAEARSSTYRSIDTPSVTAAAWSGMPRAVATSART